jgi:hypothetical protein
VRCPDVSASCVLVRVGVIRSGSCNFADVSLRVLPLLQEPIFFGCRQSSQSGGGTNLTKPRWHSEFCVSFIAKALKAVTRLKPARKHHGWFDTSRA